MDEDYRDDAEAADELREEPGVPDDPEVPEADALEQTRDVRPAGDDLPSEVGDRPEADALEQARAIDEDDEDRR
ncbi:MAG TPA: hypothetical protein VLA90_12180 [Actinomycetota bacterium]|nr:hypothetical protein [Actinomycetota bacterium]